jgi:CheY-like chemotaxis protein
LSPRARSFSRRVATVYSFASRQPYPLGQVNTGLAADARQSILPYTVGEVEMTRILIADSDPRTRQALALLLERKLGVSNAGEAWDRASLEYQLATGAPDLILLDCYLPSLSAAEIATLLGRSAGARLALMSVNADDVTTAQMLNAAFIHKGALPEEVLATLKMLIPA